MSPFPFVFIIGLWMMMVLTFMWSLPTKQQSPLVTHKPCIQTVGGGSTQMYVCSDGHAYVRNDGKWQDAGRVTPAPSVPSN